MPQVRDAGRRGHQGADERRAVEAGPRPRQGAGRRAGTGAAARAAAAARAQAAAARLVTHHPLPAPPVKQTVNNRYIKPV